LTSKMTVNEVLASVDAVLFDFDGPLCDVFAGLPAWQIANHLQAMFSTHHDTDDPLEVLRQATTLSLEDLHSLEDALIASEVKAVKTSMPQERGIEAMRKCISSGKQTGIVSNNSAKAITDFLTRFELSEHVHPIIGRAYGYPHLMKPNTWPIHQALQELETSPNRVVFIGDSMTDIEVAQATEIWCIAYANKPEKRSLFRDTNAIVVDSMDEVAKAFPQ
jgi:phosphoglycolate phosphatase